MPLPILFVAEFGPDCIEVSERLPERRPMAAPEGWTIPMFQGFSLSRIRVTGEELPDLPRGDLTREEYQQWLSKLWNYDEEQVAPILVTLGLGGICLDVELQTRQVDPYGTFLEATITNVGPDPAGKVQVAWHGQWDQRGDDPQIGRALHFRSVGQPQRQLAPDESARFALMRPELTEALSYATALASEKVYLTVSATKAGEEAFYEIKRVPGGDLWHAVEVVEKLLREEVR